MFLAGLNLLFPPIEPDYLLLDLCNESGLGVRIKKVGGSGLLPEKISFKARSRFLRWRIFWGGDRAMGERALSLGRYPRKVEQVTYMVEHSELRTHAVELIPLFIEMFGDGIVQFQDVAVLEAIINLASSFLIANQTQCTHRSQLMGDRRLAHSQNCR